MTTPRHRRRSASPGRPLVALDARGSRGVKGEWHAQAELAAVLRRNPRGPWTAVLVPEPGNPYDENAVRVEIEGLKVGFLSRAIAPRYQPALLHLLHREGALGSCPARVQRRDDTAVPQVVLSLASPDRVSTALRSRSAAAAPATEQAGPPEVPPQREQQAPSPPRRPTPPARSLPPDRLVPAARPDPFAQDGRPSGSPHYDRTDSTSLPPLQRQERDRVKAVLPGLQRLVDAAQALSRERDGVREAGRAAAAELRRQVVPVGPEDRPTHHVLPLGAASAVHADALAREAVLPVLDGEELEAVRQLVHQVAPALDDADRAGLRRLLAGRGRRQREARAIRFLLAYEGWARWAQVGRAVVGRADVDARITPSPVLEDPSALVDELADLTDPGADPVLVPTDDLAGLPDVVAAHVDSEVERRRLEQQMREATERVRADDVAGRLRQTPVERLRDTGLPNLRTGPLRAAGITDVQSLLEHRGALEDLGGIGVVSAAALREAGELLRQEAQDEAGLRLDPSSPRPGETSLVEAAARWQVVTKLRRDATDLPVDPRELAGLAEAVGRGATHLLVLPARPQVLDLVECARAAVEQVSGLPFGGPSDGSSAWRDFEARAGDYFGVLDAVGISTGREVDVVGDVPADVREAVAATELDTSLLRVPALRRYQHFAARFVLVQRRVLLGDDMGLGKTVEALAVIAHLHAKGRPRALVVCPAAVVSNWMRETEDKSALRAHRVHGEDRAAAARRWRREGGVAVTTYDTLAALDDLEEREDEEPQPLDCLVVDEAHYVKNPEASRSERVGLRAKSSAYVLLMSGTPLENRVNEFRTLAGYLDPELARRTVELSPRDFRAEVAPIYLRRNREQVLTELPEREEVLEWLALEGEDADAYAEAVAGGSIDAMRQVTMRPGSAKMDRLVQLVTEAEANDRRVIVFSFYKRVLRDVCAALPGPVFGPLQGDVPSDARQRMVDDFSAAPGGAALVCQVMAGGVGLNVQAASVVILCEPQLKPSTEEQAVARADRMGQVKSVQVYRLLSEDTVDGPLTDMLERKREVFDQYARDSSTAQDSPEATDASQRRLLKELVEREQYRLGVSSAPVA